MSLLTIIYTILIGPLQLLFEVVFGMAVNIMEHPGLAIIVLSLVMNFLVLPLYKRADAMQEAARDMDLKLRDGVKHIKKSFSGEERMMIMQTYYRQNDYKPTDALKGSISLLLEIPFFMAAYRFLAHAEILNEVAFGPIRDLGAEDRLISVGDVNINLLPILMTTINVISSAIYLKGFPLKTKVQLYAMSGFFLVFLYKSPAGLVFYWTLNNVFSLVKTLVLKLMKPRKKKAKEEAKASYDKGFFLAGAVVLTVLVGALIPSALIGSSPQEFINVVSYYNPLWYVAYTLCMAVGTFLVWMRVFYWLASPKGKAVFDKLIWIMLGIMTVNYMFFGTDFGVISADLQYEGGLVFPLGEGLINLAIVVLVAVAMFYVVKRWKRVLKGVMAILAIAVIGMSTINVVKINNSVSEAKNQLDGMRGGLPHFTLSKDGKNVVVLMLDRAMGQQIPFLFNEKPELKKQFEGFTYYSNVISFGASTNYATPALFGGYEYTPVEINKRDKELLKDKHNEALKVMPVIFDEEGYQVTVCDAPYANYQWISDMSMYDEYENISTYNVEGKFDSDSYSGFERDVVQRRFFSYSMMKTAPLCAQLVLYHYGDYNVIADEKGYFGQNMISLTESEGMDKSFMKAYNVLRNLPTMTVVEEGASNNFLMMSNNTTHEPMLLQEPEYIPAQHVDNSKYYQDNMERFTIGDVTLKMETDVHMIHYQTNMATMIQLGNWMDYLREHDVYDNTRIIIVADHGRALHQIEQLDNVHGKLNANNVETYYPLLMVKDFDSKEYKISDEFMTNGDVPTIALEGLVDNPTNPFTGNPINNDKKYNDVLYISTSMDFDVTENNGKKFTASTWYTVKDNIWDKDNWRFINSLTTMPWAK